LLIAKPSVFTSVLRSLHHLKVFWTVVALVAVNVVDDLIRSERSSDLLLCNESMLCVVPRCRVAPHPPILVASAVDASPLPVRVGLAVQPLVHGDFAALERAVNFLLSSGGQSPCLYAVG
jgi:hypothetical protein